MQANTDFTLFLKRLVIYLFLNSFFIMVCEGGKLSESESFFDFIRAVDPQNVLNISWIGSAQNPCLLQSDGIIRCNKNATNIIEIRLENLNLSGKIDADSLCRLQELKVLNLAKNYIRGNIPNSILHCTRLVYLNLSSNQLSGRIPEALTKLKFLRKLDISGNDLSGAIPSQHEFKGPLAYSVISRTSQSDSARGWLDENGGSPSSAPSPGNIASDNSKASKGSNVLVLVILGGVVLLLVAVVMGGMKVAKSATEMLIVKSPQKLPTQKPPIEITKEVRVEKEQDQIEVAKEVKVEKVQQELVFFVEESERFQLGDLLLAKAELQNESFFSSIYKVILKNNAHYAVMRLKNLQISADVFGETLRWISEFNHPNILPLVGYRYNGEEKLIIYEYQSNGSLLNLLKDCMERKRSFPWEQRLSIACGIARGLGFIYKKMEGQGIIPHGNLKLSNILLNENNEPLINECGLSKFIDPDKAFLFASHGYSAPEKSLTEKGDVYSFGVILLELLTGKNVEASGIDLPRWVRLMVREEWTGEVFDKELTEDDYQWAFPLLNIALMCVSRSPESRPNIKEILEKIEQVTEEHEQKQQQDHGFSSGCCGNDSNHDSCCSLHKIIPDTWDSPGSNY